jgi:hypothetical protein
MSFVRQRLGNHVPFTTVMSQLSTLKRQAYIIDPYHGNKSRNSGASAVKNPLAVIGSELRKLKVLRRCLLFSRQGTLLRGWLTEIRTTRVEAESNTSTVILRLVGGAEKRSIKSERVKYGHESKETRTQERLHWRGPAAYTQDRLVLLSKRAPHKNSTVIVNN